MCLLTVIISEFVRFIKLHNESIYEHKLNNHKYSQHNEVGV
jgi:hypothetical protein